MENQVSLNAINQVAPHPKVSAKYKFVSTVEAIKALENQGFELVEARQKYRSKYGVHMLKFTHPNLPKVKLGSSYILPQVVLRNSHDASAAFGLIAGAYRFACLNGLIFGHGFSVRLIHTGDVQRDISEALPKVFEVMKASIEEANNWSRLNLSENQQRAFAFTALSYRFGYDQLHNILNLKETIDQLLISRREEDNSSDLFTVFNRVQEKIMRGGLVTLTSSGIKRSRALYGARSTIGVNQKLANLAAETYKILTQGVN